MTPPDPPGYGPVRVRIRVSVRVIVMVEAMTFPIAPLSGNIPPCSFKNKRYHSPPTV